MKRAKRFMALLAATVLSFSMVVAVSGADYANLKVTTKTYYANGNRDYGKYPVIDGMAALNTKIENEIWTALTYTEKNYGDNSDANLFKVDFKVTDNNQYAQVDVTLRYQAATNAAGLKTETKTYYIDKNGNKEIATKADYDKAIEAQKTAAAPKATPTPAPKAAEAVLVPVVKNVEALGYTTSWDEELKQVRMSKGDHVTSVTVGKNKYVIKGKIVELDAAPSVQDDIVYVPVSFFEKVIGAKVTIDKSGKVTIK